jgi:rhomboid protease GluP
LEESPAAEIERGLIRLEPPRFWTFSFVINFAPLGLGTLCVGAIILIAAVGHDLAIPQKVWMIFGALAGACAAMAAGWAALRPRRVPPIRITDAEVWLPRFRISRRPTRVSLRGVYSVQTLGRSWMRRVVLGVEGRLPINIMISGFASADGPQHFDGLLRRALGALPDGVLRLAKLEHRSEVARRSRRGVPWVTVTFLGLMVLAGMVTATWQDVALPKQLLRLGANSSELLRRGEWFRLVTANFLHVAPWHLALNALALGFLGFLIERLMGSTRFALVALASALVGAAASGLIAGHLLSLGASTAVAGILAGYAWLSFRYRGDLPSPMRLPGWYWMVIAGIGLAGEIAIPNLDHAGHLGGALTGLGLIAWGCRGRPLLELSRPSLPVRIGALALTVLFAIGGFRGVRSAWTWDDARSLEMSEMMIQGLELHPYLLNNLAWDVARIAEASEGQLELAYRAMEEIVGAEPEETAFLDTQATLAWRLGRFDRALELERAALGLANEGFYASQLARFEWARFQREGKPVRIGDGSEVTATVHLEATAEGEQGGKSVVVTLDHWPRRALELHAVSLWQEQVLGHLRVSCGPEVGTTQWFNSEPSPHQRYGDDVRFEVVLVDSTGEGPAGNACSWHLWPMEPAVTALP